MKWSYNKDHPSYYYKIGDKIQHVETQELVTVLGFEPCPFNDYFPMGDERPCYAHCPNARAVLRISSQGFRGSGCYCARMPGWWYNSLGLKRQWIIIERKGEKRNDKRGNKKG